MTPYQRHRAKWTNCTECSLCHGRNKVVLLRGVVPSPILFVGEAPGASEDVIGRPFVGPAGKLLDSIIDQCNLPCSYAVTNLVACIPRNGGTKLIEPPKESMQACSARLQECFDFCKPSTIIAVGKLASSWLVGNRWIDEKSVYLYSIIHPASILRMGTVQKEIAIQRSIVTISEAVSEQEDAKSQEV